MVAAVVVMRTAHSSLSTQSAGDGPLCGVGINTMRADPAGTLIRIGVLTLLRMGRLRRKERKRSCADPYASLLVVGKHHAPVSGNLGKSLVWLHLYQSVTCPRSQR